MPKNNNLLKKIALLCMVLVIIAWGALIPAPASSQVESRISALEVDINGIESRLNRIEQLNQLGSSGSLRVPLSVPSPSPSNSQRNRSQLNREQMFDRLATLVIELKQQITALEARISKLESSRSAT